MILYFHFTVRTCWMSEWTSENDQGHNRFITIVSTLTDTSIAKKYIYSRKNPRFSNVPSYTIDEKINTFLILSEKWKFEKKGSHAHKHLLLRYHIVNIYLWWKDGHDNRDNTDYCLSNFYTRRRYMINLLDCFLNIDVVDRLTKSGESTIGISNFSGCKCICSVHLQDEINQ